MFWSIYSAGKQEVNVTELSKMYAVLDSDSGLLGNFELDRSMRFLLHHDGSCGYARTIGYISYS